MSEFHVLPCLIGIGDPGKHLVEKGVESRERGRKMVPDEDVTPEKIVLKDQEEIASDRVSSFDLVVVTGKFAASADTEQAVDLGEALNPDIASVAVLFGASTAVDMEHLSDAFDTVVSVDSEEIAREFTTDLFTMFCQPMMLRTDLKQITENLSDGVVARVGRHLSDRTQIPDVLKELENSGDVLFGFLEVGGEFTVQDAELVEDSTTESAVITGQVTLEDDANCRLSIVREVETTEAIH